MRTPTKPLFIPLLLLLMATMACNLSGSDDTPTPVFSRQPVGIPSPTPTTEADTENESNTDEEASTNSTGQSNNSLNSGETSRTNCTVRTDWIDYRVVSGDTLGSIATRTGSTSSALAQANCLSDANSIRVGQILVVPALPQNTSSNGSSGNNNTSSNRLPTDFVALVDSVNISAGTIRVLTGQENTFSTLQVVQNGVSIPLAFQSGKPATINNFEVWMEVYVQGYIVPGNPPHVVPESIMINDVDPRSGVAPFTLENVVVDNINIDNKWMEITNGGDIRHILIKAAVPENTWAEVFLPNGEEASLNDLRAGSVLNLNGYRWVGSHYAVEIILLSE